MIYIVIKLRIYVSLPHLIIVLLNANRLLDDARTFPYVDERQKEKLKAVFARPFPCNLTTD